MYIRLKNDEIFHISQSINEQYSNDQYSLNFQISDNITINNIISSFSNIDNISEIKIYRDDNSLLFVSTKYKYLNNINIQFFEDTQYIQIQLSEIENGMENNNPMTKTNEKLDKIIEILSNKE